MGVRRIWKYTLELDDQQMIEAPQHFRPLTVQFQAGLLCLWAEVTAESEQDLLDPSQHRGYRIRIYGTGHDMAPFQAGEMYLGSVQQSVLESAHLIVPLVWHVYMEA